MAAEERFTDRAVASCLTAAEPAQWGKGGEQSSASGKGQTWQAGSAKVEKQVEESRKQTCSPELKKREFSEVLEGMVEADRKQQAI